MNRKGPMDSVVNKDIWNPSGRVSEKLVSPTLREPGPGVEVGSSVPCGDGTGVGVSAFVGTGVPTDAGVGEATCWAAIVEGTNSGVAAEKVVAVGSGEPQAPKTITMGTNADNLNQIRITLHP